MMKPFMQILSRILLLMIACVPCVTSGCNPSNDSQTQQSQSQTVTLYTSVDDQFAKMVVDAFTEETGIKVEVLGDTEATKTTGLVTRIQAEINHPRADIWWSSEPMGTIMLAESGALEPEAMRGMANEDWPGELRADDWSWIGMAMRARVIGYSSDRVDSPPTTLAELADPQWKGKVGIAHPHFGTTRIHMAILANEWGIPAYTQWLQAMRGQNVRIYDGNAKVVQALALGEIDVGLTDTDDIWSGQANGWNVDLVYESKLSHDDWPSDGPTLIPNTVAIIKDCQHPELAQQLASYLVSARVEEMLYRSTTHNTPVDPELREELFASPGNEILDISELPDYHGASAKVREAMNLCDQVLISP